LRFRTEALLGSLTALIGAGVAVNGWQLGFSLDAEGAGLFPGLVGICLVLCGLVQVATAKTSEPGASELSDVPWPLVLKTFGLLVVYVVLVDILGYFLATLLFAAAQAWLLGARGWIKLGGFAVLTSVAFTFVFQVWMQMPLPTGVLGAWRF
jgi:putative tricarboxylic transport membrane protein